MTNLERFRQLIDEPPPPSGPDETDALVQPLRDLAEVLRERAVGAEVQTSADGRRYHLALWPLHRPAFRSIMVTVAIENGGRLMVSGGNEPWLRLDAAGLTQWLEKFVQRPEFRASLDDLRAQAKEPVDARLERENGMATLVQVPAEMQEMLDAHPSGGELALDVPLNDHEPTPDAEALRRLNSAGVHFGIRRAEVNGRTVHLELLKAG